MRAAALFCIFAAQAAELRLLVGETVVVDVPDEVVRVSTTNPEVIDTATASRKEVLLNAKASGVSTVIVWSKTGGRTIYSVTAEQNLEPLRKLLRDAFPDERIQVFATRDSIALSGTVSAALVAERALALAAPAAKAVVNNLRVAPAGPEKQIVLRVKFAELNRTAATQFGMSLISTGAANTPGRLTTGQFPSATASEVTGAIGGSLRGTSSTFKLSDLLNVFAFRPDLNLGAVIRALETQGLLQVIAEPNLVTTNGKEASFLVGGEFPVPVVQGGANVGAVTVQFREFGIRLTFLPVLTADNGVRMHVKPEVSSIDQGNGVQLSGFNVPALSTRRMETNIELSFGQSFLIAGLLDERVTENLSRIPGLASIPILGQVFQSRSRSRTATELVVIVTPELASPHSASAPAPLPPMPREFLPPAPKTPPVKGAPKSSKEKR